MCYFIQHLRATTVHIAHGSRDTYTTSSIDCHSQQCNKTTKNAIAQLTEIQWDLNKDHIVRLYQREQLSAVVKHMKERHGFCAT